MPYINSKVSVKLTKENKETIKQLLGEAISIIPGKSESWLMVGFEEECQLYFQGNNAEPTAFIEVKIFGKASHENYCRLTARICDIFEAQLGIPQNRIYVKYEEASEWGWNGSNF